MVSHLSYKELNFIILLLASNISWSSTFSITPVTATALPTSILPGQSATAYYKVQNNTLTPQKYNHIQLPPNVKQVVTKGIYSRTCDSNTVIGTWGCILQLTIDGPVASDDPEHANHLAVCEDELNCSTINDKRNELNVTADKANPLARIAIVNEYTQSSPIDIKPVAYSSNDGGISWMPHEIRATSKGFIKKITCDKNNHYCTAVGNAYRPTGGVRAFLAFNSIDGGFNWTSHVIGIHTGVSGVLIDVVCNKENNQYCVAVGGYSKPDTNVAPIVYTSSDRGVNWTPNYPKSFGTYGSVLRAVSCGGHNNQYCTAVGDFSSSLDNKIYNATTFFSYTSTDGGLTWTAKIIEMHQGGSGSLLNAITCNKDNGLDCLAVGYITSHAKPIIYKTNNGGIDWVSYAQEQPHVGRLNDIMCNQNNDQHCMAIGDGGKYPTLYKSNDGGSSWIPSEFSSRDPDESYGPDAEANTRKFQSITCSDSGQYCTIIGYAVFHIGKILMTIPIVHWSMDSGKTWYQRRPFTADSQNGLMLHEVTVYEGLDIT